MSLENANAIFIEDEEGIIVITDIQESKKVLLGEFVYDGKNVGILNRNNEKYYALQNIPPSMRENLLKSEEITIIEKDSDADITTYSVKVRAVEDIGIPDMWDEYSENLINDLQNALTEEEFDRFISK